MNSPSDLSISRVVAGREAQGKRKTDGALSVLNSTAEVKPTFNLDSIRANGRSKYAGDGGFFAMELANNPEALARTDKWMAAFENFAPWKEGTSYQKG